MKGSEKNSVAICLITNRRLTGLIANIFCQSLGPSLYRGSTVFGFPSEIIIVNKRT